MHQCLEKKNITGRLKTASLSSHYSANSGGSGNYSNSRTSSDVYESSATTYYTVYFEKVTIKSDVSPLIGVAFKW